MRSWSSRLLAAALPVVIGTVIAILLAACAGLLGSAAPAIEQAAVQGVAAMVQAAAQAQHVPPSDPAYQAALAAARGLDAAKAKRAAARAAEEKEEQAQIAAILAAVKACADDAGAAALPTADAGREGGS